MKSRAGTADIRSGGRVSGRIVLAGGLAGTHRARGDFVDGLLSYAGRVPDVG